DSRRTRRSVSQFGSTRARNTPTWSAFHGFLGAASTASASSPSAMPRLSSARGSSVVTPSMSSTGISGSIAAAGRRTCGRAAGLLVPNRANPLTMVSYAFFHADALHWAVNMAFLLACAPRVERAVGTPVMLGFFVAGAVVAGLLHLSMVYLFMPSQAGQPLL